MTFVQEYTFYFLQGSQLFISFRAFGPSGNKQFEIPSGNKSVYSFMETHDIVCLNNTNEIIKLKYSLIKTT